MSFFCRNLSSEGTAAISADSSAASSTYSEPELSLSETMRRVLSLENASQEEKNAFRLRQVVKECQLHPTDTGSPEVQVAIFTERMAQLSEHVKVHRKDHNSKRGLIQLVADRRGMLKYLRRESEDRYLKLIERLGIRDAVSLLPPRVFLPAKAAIAAANRERQKAQAKVLGA
eukprot:CAMPEP_0172195620 /NCGR_PEP_ID=MMETSP1050-20130122/26317_1 /TAXON_ID=233186 /ORGANISM="Cryptomonas curvata, Strain CCAP979/52" /LENGTH=172 /DNA_ID=CAMNT_0012871719 /DNA_START=97 /DNA_END=611 /DNA_ORIENTATION=+